MPPSWSGANVRPKRRSAYEDSAGLVRDHGRRPCAGPRICKRCTPMRRACCSAPLHPHAPTRLRAYAPLVDRPQVELRDPSAAARSVLRGPDLASPTEVAGQGSSMLGSQPWCLPASEHWAEQAQWGLQVDLGAAEDVLGVVLHDAGLLRAVGGGPWSTPAGRARCGVSLALSAPRLASPRLASPYHTPRRRPSARLRTSGAA